MPLSLFGEAHTETPAKFEAGALGFAVGDIHGRADLLARMLKTIADEALAADALKPVVVFLGDYIDRGPASAEVITRLLDWRLEGGDIYFLKGNHEEAMLAFLDDPIANRNWLDHGGVETLASYGVHPLPALAASDGAVNAACEKLRQLLPANHETFLRTLKRYYTAGDYAFVHAGVDCARSIDDQLDEDLFWVRAKFLSDKRRFSHVVVHGHTVVDTPYRDQRRIGVDTGAYATGRLSGVRLEDEGVRFLSVE